MHRDDQKKVAWLTFDGLQPYGPIHNQMRQTADQLIAGTADEQVWMLEHSPIITHGISANLADIQTPTVPVVETDRGGQVTYHGPGQLIAYTLLDLRPRKKDVKAFVWTLEQWVINTLARFDVVGERRKGRVGVWVVKPDGSDAKIAAIGVKIRKWVAYHGISLNVCPNLDHYNGFVPCGITDHGVTSLADLGISATVADVQTILQAEFKPLFGDLQSAHSTTQA